MKILVVDDDLLNRRVLADILEPYGRCDLAVNGYEALESFQREREAGEPYDLITLDVVMPGMDGTQVLKQIRSLEDAEADGGHPVKVIMVTSESDADTILTSYDSRCDAYLTKPVDGQKLVERMKYLGLIG